LATSHYMVCPIPGC